MRQHPALTYFYFGFLIVLLFFSSLSFSQYPPKNEQDSSITTIHSPVDGNITVRFKTPPVGTCTTIFPSQKQYTGYVTIPPFKLNPIQQNYAVNTFFWFVEARTDPDIAPLTIFLNGGPGVSTMTGLFQEVGPCEVVEVAQGKFGTQARDWGWDRSSNIVFIDQPNQVGFSFDQETNGSLNLLSSEISFPPSIAPEDQPGYTFLNGTFSSNNINSTANTTEIAAHTIWHMLQAFLDTFPQYNPGLKPNSTQSSIVGINLFTESYGGKYAPVFADHFESQNLLRRNGQVQRNGTLEIRLSSVGIISGCIDDLVQGRYYPIFANNNTYGIKAISLADEQNAASSFTSANGCQQQIQTCRDAVALNDPHNEGDVNSVNQLCKSAADYCNKNVMSPYLSFGNSLYDITQKEPSPFPPSTYIEYLNTAELQSAIGVSINYTESNNASFEAFHQTGDSERGNQIAQISYLLSLGIRVALIYGDRDYICNWFGGEAVSFSIAAQSPAYNAFYSSGYADIVVNSTYVGGVVRQYGNLSFSRIYDAGHLIPAYQPETAFTVFTRIITGTGISLGEQIDLGTFQTTGDSNATHTNKASDSAKPTCWIRNIAQTCSDDQKDMIQKGDGSVINGVLYSQLSDWDAPASSVSIAAGYPGTIAPAMTAAAAAAQSSGPKGATSEIEDVPTGVYTATATPSPSKEGKASKAYGIGWSAPLWPILQCLVGSLVL